MIDQAEIDLRFTYHPPSRDQVVRMGAIRREAKKLAELIVEFLPAGGREQSLALTKIEEAVMHANSGMVRREPKNGETADTEKAAT